MMYNSEKHFAHLYSNAPRKFAFRAKTRREFQVWQTAFRRELRKALGLPNMETDLCLHRPTAQRLKREDLGDHWRETWQLWVEPTVPLPFYLLIPKTGTKKFPLALTPHGHNEPPIYVGITANEKQRRHMLEGDRDIARQAAREGYLTIAPTARGFGDTRTTADRKDNKLSSCRVELLHGLLVGRTVIGERVWDISRLLDWALGRADVDERRIVITGNSGGGTISLFAAACDTRIKVSAPGSYFCAFAASIGSIFHCECNYVPGMLRLGEMHDVAGLIAPRPFCAIHGKTDPIFPIADTRRAFRRVQQIYKVAGAVDCCELYVGNGGHRFYKDGAWPFVRKHFAALSR